MKKTFISNLILLMSVNLLIKPFWILGIDRSVQNAVGYEEYGTYIVLLYFSMLFITLLDLGINTYTSSNIAQNPDKLRQEFAALTTFKLASSFLYIAITISLGMLNGFDSYRIKLLWILGLNQILSYFYTYFRSIVGGLQLFKTDAILSVVDRCLMIILCSLMLWFGVAEMTITHFIMAQTIAYTAAVFISFMVIKSHLHALQWSFNKVLLLKVIKQMLPYALLSLTMTFYTRMDVILLEKLLPDGYYQSGIYASAYRLLEAANMMAALVSMLLLPIFSRMLSNKENISPLLQFSTGIMILPAFAFSIACFIYRQPIIELLNNHSTTYAGSIFGYVILSFIPLSTMYVYGTLLTANGNLRTLNILAVTALFINLLLNFILIRNMKAEGAAITALCTQTFIGLSNFYFGKKIVRINFDRDFVKKFFSSLGLIAILAVGTNYFITSWYLGILLIGSGSLLIMIIFKIIDLKQGLLLVRSRFSEKSS
ncbi:MAG: oligosaccharide flippase family protein [Bacteroidia bacterium]|nr:oligosaccharide flippase family protein [Bacteroidia bacterium]